MLPRRASSHQTGAAGRLTAPGGGVIPGRLQVRPNGTKVTIMTMSARGTFDVTLTPQPSDDVTLEGAPLVRMAIDKRFHGPLDATSKGQMLAARTVVEGSAGYVALERVSGTLDGRAGTFVLQHSGTMNRGAPELTITVVPDSGTGPLAGLAGRMVIHIADGRHSYEFTYTLP